MRSLSVERETERDFFQLLLPIAARNEQQFCLVMHLVLPITPMRMRATHLVNIYAWSKLNCLTSYSTGEMRRSWRPRSSNRLRARTERAAIADQSCSAAHVSCNLIQPHVYITKHTSAAALNLLCRAIMRGTSATL